MNKKKTHLYLNLNTKHKNQKKTYETTNKKIRCAKKKCKQISTMIKYENINIKGI